MSSTFPIFFDRFGNPVSEKKIKRVCFTGDTTRGGAALWALDALLAGRVASAISGVRVFDLDKGAGASHEISHTNSKRCSPPTHY